ncbi:MAG: hypothetical protein JW741_21485 [Sedimentisphaerales bacterium]|nr:hypothetical protein [Sedimentisphaerales bacterium]
MKRMRRTMVWLTIAGVLLATTLSGCKKEGETTPTAGGARTSQTETPEPNE